MAESLIKIKTTQCNKAFGHEKFCKCVMNRIPVSASFYDYLNITISNKKDLNYAKLSDENKSIVDKIREARNFCVSDNF